MSDDLMEPVDWTSRGFQITNFLDANGKPCSLQQSSAIDDTMRGMSQPGSSLVWLGAGDERMHLSRSHVVELCQHLRQWLVTGMFIMDPTAPDSGHPKQEPTR